MNNNTTKMGQQFSQYSAESSWALSRTALSQAECSPGQRWVTTFLNCCHFLYFLTFYLVKNKVLLKWYRDLHRYHAVVVKNWIIPAVYAEWRVTEKPNLIFFKAMLQNRLLLTTTPWYSYSLCTTALYSTARYSYSRYSDKKKLNIEHFCSNLCLIFLFPIFIQLF